MTKTCPHAAAGCNFPDSECSGHCLIENGLRKRQDPPGYLTIVYRITHPKQPRALLEQAEWSAASHTHAIRARDLMEAQRDELLESLATCRANFRRHEEETLKMAQAEDEERASLRAQRDELLEALKGVIEVADFHELYGRRTDAARAAIAKATGETK